MSISTPLRLKNLVSKGCLLVLRTLLECVALILVLTLYLGWHVREVIERKIDEIEKQSSQ